MKIIKYLILIILVIFPINVRALNAVPKIECDKNVVNVNESVNCKYSLEISNGNINAVSARYSFESKNIILSTSKIGNWYGNSDGNRIDYVDYNSHTDNVDIVNFQITAKNQYLNDDVNTIITITLKELGDQNGVAHNYNIITTFNIKILKNNIVPTTKKQPEPTTTKRVVTTTTSTKKKNSVQKTTKTTTTTTSTTMTTITTNDDTSEPTTTTKRVVENKTKDKKSLNILIIVILLLIMITLIILLIKAIKEKREQDLYG